MSLTELSSNSLSQSIFGPDLFDAAEKGDTDILEWLVKCAGSSDINYQRTSRVSINFYDFFFSAVFHGCFSPASLPIQQPHLPGTPLTVAVSKGHTQAVRILLTHPLIHVDSSCPDNVSAWALGLACQRSDASEIVDMLSTHPSVNINRQDVVRVIYELHSRTKIMLILFSTLNAQCGRTVLMVAALQTDGATNVRALLSQEGVLVGLKNNVGYKGHPIFLIA